jgi:hypothetical protein
LISPCPLQRLLKALDLAVDIFKADGILGDNDIRGFIYIRLADPYARRGDNSAYFLRHNLFSLTSQFVMQHVLLQLIKIVKSKNGII